MNWNPADGSSGPGAGGGPGRGAGPGPTVSLSISGPGVVGVGNGVQVGNPALHQNTFNQQPRPVQGSFRPHTQMQLQQQQQLHQQTSGLHGSHGPNIQVNGQGSFDPHPNSHQYPRKSVPNQVGGQVGQDPMMALRTMTNQQQGLMGDMMGPNPGQNPQQAGGGLNPLAMQQPRQHMMMNQGQGNPMMVQQMGQRPPQPGSGGVGPPQQGMMVMGPQQGKMRPQMPSQPQPSSIGSQSAVSSPMGSSMTTQMAPSPAAYAHSPSGGIVPSPVGVAATGAYLRQGQVGAPSPGSALNAPINSVASPASGPLVGNHGHQNAGGAPGARNADDQAYLDKLKHLNKYIDPLRRMIARIDKDEDRKKDLQKMKSLLDILSDPSRRCPMETLLKCEQVLERLDLRVRNTDQNMIGHVPSVTSMARLQNDNLWQPLLDAINANIKSPMFNHTLHRVFGQPITMLLGAAYSQSSTTPTSPPSKRRCVSSAVEDMYEVSDVLQNEIAHLDQRFKVQLDPVQQFGNKTIKLICQLDDKALPSVPPITVTVPENYPESPPLYSANSVQYASTTFYVDVLSALKVHMNKMPSQFSVTALLDTWEMCVRQTCSTMLPSLRSPAKA